MPVTVGFRATYWTFKIGNGQSCEIVSFYPGCQFLLRFWELLFAANCDNTDSLITTGTKTSRPCDRINRAIGLQITTQQISIRRRLKIEMILQRIVLRKQNFLCMERKALIICSPIVKNLLCNQYGKLLMVPNTNVNLSEEMTLQ